MPDWYLQPGDTIERVTLHEEFGGRTQGGIGPSSKSGNVFVFTDPASGEQYGYIDTWRDDGCFHYTGEGQRGDQQMKSGNKAILQHEQDGRALRLFTGARGTVRYEGEFDLDTDQPWYTTDAPEVDPLQTRSVIVFRMRPKDVPAKPPKSKLDAVAGEPGVTEVPVEEQWTEKAFVNPSRDLFEAERREQKLVREYMTHLERQGHDVCRLKIVAPGEAKPLFTDLYDRTTGTLIEAKGSVKRESIRMAIGQLADYRRHVGDGPKELAVLLPSEPRPDLLALLKSQTITTVWPDRKTKFVSVTAD
jgi:hypothetical protein